MKNPLSFFSPKPAASVRLLTTFLQRCQIYCGHLISSPVATSNNNKHQINTLLKPLNLSRRDRKTLINEQLLPLSTFPLTTNDIFTALRNKDQPAFPCQVCDNCAPSLFKYYGYRLADNGWCSQCHQQGDCLDIPLIEHYRKYGIDDDTIDRYLPRKRWASRNTGIPPLYRSLKDIEVLHQTLFDAFEAKKDRGH